MPAYTLPMIALLRRLENGLCLAEPLFTPEVSRLGTGEKRLLDGLAESIAALLRSQVPGELHRRLPPQQVEQDRVGLVLEPPRRALPWRKLAWRQPVELSFDVVRWTAPDGTLLATVPLLGLDLPGRTLEELAQRLSAEIRTDLMRRKAISLGDLVWLQRDQALRVVPFPCSADLPSLQQRASQAEREARRDKPLLPTVATDLRDAMKKLPRAHEVDVRPLAAVLTARTARSVLLVGPSGVGKTALVYELVRRADQHGLGRTPFWETSGARLMAGAGGFGMWEERCNLVRQEAARTNAILLLGNLVELAEVGKCGAGAHGMAHFLRPFLERREFRAIAEVTTEQLALLDREDPHLIAAFHPIEVREPPLEAARSILLHAAVDLETAAAPGMEADTIETILRLHRRYATYSVFPGRPLRFMRNLAASAAPESSTRGPAASDAAEAFAHETGLPRWLLHDEVPLELKAAERWFTERVLGQPSAVDLVVGLLAQIKSELSRPARPLASLLFIGPTGVGKTEMAKCLAEYLFGERHRMVRFDMSEYADALAVERLIGHGVGSSGLLTARVREQPFMVVLFDELEKAHPTFFDLLLQVLGEARLSDAAGRLADFRNAVIIMTSNAGAATFQRGPLGFIRQRETDRALAHFTSEVRALFRPELFNRVDRIVPFAPLDADTALRITRRELDAVLRRDGVTRRAVTVEVGEGVAEHLTESGFDARYGARPLKRALERQLLAPLAAALNQYAADLPLRAVVRRGAKTLGVTVTADTTAAAIAGPLQVDAALQGLVDRVADLRRDAHRMQHSPAALHLENDIFQLQRLQQRLEKSAYQNPVLVKRLLPLPGYLALAERLRDVTRQTDDLEERALLSSPTALELSTGHDTLQGEFGRLLLDLFVRGLDAAGGVILAFFGERMRELFNAYHTDMRLQGFSVTAASLHLLRGDALQAARAAAEKKLLASLPANATNEDREAALADLEARKPYLWERRIAENPATDGIGLLLHAAGPLATARYGAESGVHVMSDGKTTQKCLVQAATDSLERYTPPPDMQRRPRLDAIERRRSYLLTEACVDDKALGRKFSWANGNLLHAVSMAVAARLLREARRAVFGEEET